MKSTNNHIVEIEIENPIGREYESIRITCEVRPFVRYNRGRMGGDDSPDEGGEIEDIKMFRDDGSIVDEELAALLYERHEDEINAAIEQEIAR